jgi:hypothetical protein
MGSYNRYPTPRAPAPRQRRLEVRRERDLRRAIASTRRIRRGDASAAVTPQFDLNLSPLLDLRGRPTRH